MHHIQTFNFQLWECDFDIRKEDCIFHVIEIWSSCKLMKTALYNFDYGFSCQRQLNSLKVTFIHISNWIFRNGCDNYRAGLRDLNLATMWWYRYHVCTVTVYVSECTMLSLSITLGYYMWNIIKGVVFAFPSARQNHSLPFIGCAVLYLGPVSLRVAIDIKFD